MLQLTPRDRRDTIEDLLEDIGPDGLYCEWEYEMYREDEPGISDEVLTARFYARDAGLLLEELPGGEPFWADCYFETRRLLGHLYYHQDMVDASRHIISEALPPRKAERYARDQIAAELARDGRDRGV